MVSQTHSRPLAARPDPLAELGLSGTSSVPLLKALHILTPDGRINQDSRRKLKQVRHLVQFITPLLDAVAAAGHAPHLLDFGAGKSYLGFMLWDAWFAAQPHRGRVTGIEWRADLVSKSQDLARQFGFTGMQFLATDAASASPAQLGQVDVVTALHACDTATDDAIEFALAAKARHLVLVPCCQATLAAGLRANKAQMALEPLSELWRHAHHAREFGSQVTNVLRCLRLEAAGYHVSVTELVGWEHSMKNELISASFGGMPRAHASRSAQRAQDIANRLGLDANLRLRFGVPTTSAVA